MARRVMLAVLGTMCLTMGLARGSSDRGHYREQETERPPLEHRFLEANETYEFSDVFRANQRSCVIVEGDHKERGASLTLKVLDAAGNTVAQDSSGDCLAVFWYPVKAARYKIVIKNNSGANDLDVVVK